MKILTAAFMLLFNYLDTLTKLSQYESVHKTPHRAANVDIDIDL